MEYTLTHDCPHCNTKHVGFCPQEAFEISDPNWSIIMSCNFCNKIITVEVAYESESFSKIDEHMSEPKHFDKFTIIDIHPKPKETTEPLFCPDNIRTAFIQAEKSLASQSYDACAVMDRRVLELATKNISPNDQKLPLIQRINKLADLHLITPALKEWAHELRLIGNEGAHDEEGVTEEDAKDGHELTKYMLIYLYTLPEQVRAAKKRKQKSK